MTIELSFEPRDGYLYVEASGRFELAEAQAATARIIQACLDQKQWKALLDIRALQGSPTDTERFRYGESVAAQVADAGQRAGAPLRLAYVGHMPLIDPDRFVVTVAQNRGVRILVTESMDAALRWLGVS